MVEIQFPVTLGAREDEAPHDGDDVTQSDPPIKTPDTCSKIVSPAGQSLKATAVTARASIADVQ